MKFLEAAISLLDRIGGKVLWTCRWLTILLVAAIAADIFLGVFFRYVLNNSLAWYEESAKYMMFWLVFSGAPIVLKQRGHIALDILPRQLAPRLRNFNYLVIYSVVFALMCVFVWYGYDLAWKARNQSATTIPITFFWVYLPIPLGCAVMAVISLEFCLIALKGMFRPDEKDPGPGDTVDSALS